MRHAVTTGAALLRKATHEPSYVAEDRVNLARMAGVLRYLTRNLDDFLAVGDATLAALAADRREDARIALLGFSRFAQTFGPDLSQVRRELADLTDRSTAPSSPGKSTGKEGLCRSRILGARS